MPCRYISPDTVTPNIHTSLHICASFSTLPLAYAMMESRIRTPAAYQALEKLSYGATWRFSSSERWLECRYGANFAEKDV
jgi:hypothetical protein